MPRIEDPLGRGDAEITIDKRSGHIHIDRLFVDPGERSQGVGRYLMEQVLAVAEGLNRRKVDITVNVLPIWEGDRDIAISLLQRAGFAEYDDPGVSEEGFPMRLTLRRGR